MICCAIGTPSAEQLMIASIVDELACFDVYPRSATIDPKASLTLTLSYKYTSLKFGGVHRLPLLFRVMHGKQVWIDLMGETLPPSTALLFLPDHGEVQLRPVSIGLPVVEVPTQTLRLWNVGDIDVPYNVEVVDYVEPSPLVGSSAQPLSLLADNGVAAATSPLEIPIAFRPSRAGRHAFRVQLTYRGQTASQLHVLADALTV